MKKSITTITVLLLVVALPGFSQVINGFSATTENQNVVLTWNSTLEANVISYQVQRSFDGQKFHNIGAIDPLGNNMSYRFVDRDLFKGQVQTYYYRIEVTLKRDRVEYSAVNQITMISSGINRTWGSIKAMFR